MGRGTRGAADLEGRQGRGRRCGRGRPATGVVVARVARGRRPPELGQALPRPGRRRGRASATSCVGVRNMRDGDIVPWARPRRTRAGRWPSRCPRATIRGVAPTGCCARRESCGSPRSTRASCCSRDGLDPGDDVKAALGLDDAVLDIEVEPNRPDLLSVIGVAREVAAADRRAAAGAGRRARRDRRARRSAAHGARSMRPTGAPATSRAWCGVSAAARRPPGAGAADGAPACGRCRRRRCDELRDARARPAAARVRPATLDGPGIVVRRATDGETLATLDDVERVADPGGPADRDDERPVAIAGIMGGATAEVSDDTGRRAPGERVLRRLGASCGPPAASDCTPRRRSGSSAAPTPRRFEPRRLGRAADRDVGRGRGAREDRRGGAIPARPGVDAPGRATACSARRSPRRTPTGPRPAADAVDRAGTSRPRSR